MAAEAHEAGGAIEEALIVLAAAEQEVVDKSLKVGEDEWRERERRSTKFYASKEV